MILSRFCLNCKQRDYLTIQKDITKLQITLQAQGLTISLEKCTEAYIP